MSSSLPLVAHHLNRTLAQSTQTPSLRNEHTYIPFLIHIIPLFIIMFNYTIEVPNTNIREERASLDECWDICYDMAQQFGYAEVVFYALNGNRVVQGSYTDQD
mgnify:FL=1